MVGFCYLFELLGTISTISIFLVHFLLANGTDGCFFWCKHPFSDVCFLEGLSVTRTDVLLLIFLTDNLYVNNSQGSKPMVKSGSTVQG